MTDADALTIDREDARQVVDAAWHSFDEGQGVPEALLARIADKWPDLMPDHFREALAQSEKCRAQVAARTACPSNSATWKNANPLWLFWQPTGNRNVNDE